MTNQVSMPIEEIGRIGEEIYQTRLRASVEAEPSNIGKFLSVDVLSGDYEIGTDRFANVDRIRDRRRDAIVYSLRIGYNAVGAIGGQVKRVV